MCFSNAYLQASRWPAFEASQSSIGGHRAQQVVLPSLFVQKEGVCIVGPCSSQRACYASFIVVRHNAHKEELRVEISKFGRCEKGWASLPRDTSVKELLI